MMNAIAIERKPLYNSYTVGLQTIDTIYRFKYSK